MLPMWKCCQLPVLPMAWCVSMASHVFGVLGVVLSVLARPLENEIPFGRPANWKWHSTHPLLHSPTIKKLSPSKKPCHRRGKICYNLGN